MTQRRTVIAVGATAVAAALAGIGVGVWRASVDARDVDATESLFALTLPDALGAQQPLAQWKGRPLVVNFWAPWCVPCVEEMPDLQRVRDDYRARGVEIIGVGIDSAAKIRAFRDQHGITLPLLVAGMEGTALGDRLGNKAGVLPYTVVIGPDRRVVERKIGRIRQQELRGWLDKLASAPG